MLAAVHSPGRSTSRTNSSSKLRVDLDRGLALHSAGKFDEAEIIYRGVLALDPNFPDVLRLLGLVNLALHRLDLALSLLRAAVAQDPKRAETYFSLGNALQVAHQFPESIANYRRALAIKPKYPEVLCNLGNALTSSGQLADAAEAYREALRLDPKLAAAFCSLGVVLQRLGQYDQAILACECALVLNPSYADVLNNLGIIYRALGRRVEALAAYRKALAVKPHFPEVFYNIANIFEDNGEWEAAFQSYLDALKLDPNYAEAFFGLGKVSLHNGRWIDARQLFTRCLTLQPHFVDAIVNIGHAFQKEKCFDDAILAYRQALTFSPNDRTTLNNLGVALQSTRRWEEAIGVFKEVLSLDPDQHEVLNNLGIVLLLKNELVAAETALRRALILRPRYAEAHNTLGNILMADCRCEEALAAFRAASQIDPNFASADFNEGVALLLTGNFLLGWPKYERRFALNPNRLAYKGIPTVNRSHSLAGKRVLVQAEQGLGDTVQFIRYVSALSLRKAIVYLQVQKPLRRLLASMPGVAGVFTEGETLPEVDYQCPLLSLPLLFDTDLSTIPSATPYLFCTTPLLQFWKTRLSVFGFPRVGLVWAGNPQHENDHNRSLSLGTFRALFEQTDIQFFNLNRQRSPSEATLLSESPNVTDPTVEFTDLADTAAVIEQLDLVISVDTGVAHLAGALGKPVWLLLPFAPDWRWLLQREDSPWYPTARLFRQPTPGNWPSVIARVQATLADHFKPVATPQLAPLSADELQESRVKLLAATQNTLLEATNPLS